MKTLQAELAFQNRSTLGEGALWDVRRQRLLWVDIYQDKVFLFDPKRRANLAYSVGSNVGTVVPEGKDKLLLALRHEICSLDLETGVVTSVCRPEPMGAGMRFNDGKCDPEGRFWVGSMVEKGEPGRSALYRIDHDYRAEKLLGGLTISNGLVWHGEHFYHIDTPTQQIRRFAYDARQGSISGPAVVARIEKETGAPDGMCLDAEGMLWVALFGGGGVVRIDPDSGKMLLKVEVPVTNVTSCAFGGPELDVLFITTASAGLESQELEAQPLAGSLFSVQLPYRGVPAPEFGGAGA